MAFGVAVKKRETRPVVDPGVYEFSVVQLTEAKEKGCPFVELDLFDDQGDVVGNLRQVFDIKDHDYGAAEQARFGQFCYACGFEEGEDPPAELFIGKRGLVNVGIPEDKRGNLLDFNAPSRDRGPGPWFRLGDKEAEDLGSRGRVGRRSIRR